jgi:hypothetical protein
MYAKNTRAAPAKIPLIPNAPGAKPRSCGLRARSGFRAGRRDERRVIARLDEEHAGHDHQQHDADLDDHKDEIDLRGDLDPEADDGREDQHDCGRN